MKISIPKQCHEDWNKMTPETQGRFCSSCEKTVVDFTGWPIPDIQRYLSKHSQGKTCGRFRSEQLSQPVSILISHEVLYTVPKHKRFLLALFIVFGTTLCSCTDFGGNRKMLGVVMVTLPDSIITHKDSTIEELSGEVEAIPDSIPAKPLPHKANHSLMNVIPDIDTLPLTVVGELRVIEEDTTEKNKPLPFAEVMPEFPGGYDSLMKFVYKNLKLPPDGYCFEGNVIVQFTVEMDGNIKNVEIRKGLFPEYDKEVLDLIQKMPNWTPGMNNGKKVPVRMTLPIRIEIR